MSFSVGIVGLPNVGKSTLFKALTKKEVDIASYPFTTISPNVGVVAVPDEYLARIAEIIKPDKITPTIIEFVDIAGLVKGAHKGEGLGNQFLANIRSCDAILEVVRDFEAGDIEHVEGEINPQKDIKIIETELLMKDLETIERSIEKLEKEAKSGDSKIINKIELFKKIKETTAKGEPISVLPLSKEEKDEIKEFQFLTSKPIFYVLNTNGGINDKTKNTLKEIISPSLLLGMNLKIENELSELSALDVKELGIESQLDRLISTCYNIIDLITFYTVAGGKEARAWTLKIGENILAAANLVHSDFAENFIRGEVVLAKDLTESGSWHKAREAGKIKIAGRDYTVQQGDVIEFKI